MSRIRLFSLVNESISFQSDRFGKEIEIAIDTCRNSDDKDYKKFFDNLKLIIKTYTKLNVRLVNLDSITKKPTIYSLTATLNIDHILNNDDDRNNIREVNKSLTQDASFRKWFKYNNEATVNLKTATVSGYFEKVVNTIRMSFLYLILNNKFTPSELTAMILHEVGHIFTIIEFQNRLIRTNQALAFISKALMDKTTADIMKYNYEFLGEELANNKKAFDGLENISDNAIVNTILLKTSFEAAKSELSVPQYNITACEYLADQFVSRHGYGKELVIALDKVGRKQKILNDFGPVVDITKLISATLISTLALPISPICAAMSGLFLLIGFVLKDTVSFNEFEDYSYDTLRTRCMRIKEQLIEQIKDEELDNDTSNKVIKDLQVIDECISGIKDHESIFAKIGVLFSKKNRDIRDAIKLQRDLEELSSNDLFIKSAKLKLL